jgi:hypothetical protein
MLLRLILPVVLLLLGSCTRTHVEGTTPGECIDQEDNDGDGLLDCDDPNCANAPDCQGDDDDSDDDDDDSSHVADDDDSSPAQECRPIDEPWIPGTPLRLPCEPTTEACDTIDNDNDGFTDPHCPTMPCTQDGVNWSCADCTFGGLLLDADCNEWNLPEPGCNQIDGVPFDAPTYDCWGMLCPPDLKCVEGDCIIPGTTGPNEPCSSGAECPIHAGCIPSEHGDTTTGVCLYFCANIPCPEGFQCNAPPGSETPSGISVTHRVCEPIATREQN